MSHHIRKLKIEAMLLVGALLLWSTLAACQSSLHLSLPKENNSLAVDVIAEVIQQKVSDYKGSYYDATAISQEKFIHKVYL